MAAIRDGKPVDNMSDTFRGRSLSLCVFLFLARPFSPLDAFSGARADPRRLGATGSARNRIQSATNRFLKSSRA